MALGASHTFAQTLKAPCALATVVLGAFGRRFPALNAPLSLLGSAASEVLLSSSLAATAHGLLAVPWQQPHQILPHPNCPVRHLGRSWI